MRPYYTDYPHPKRNDSITTLANTEYRLLIDEVMWPIIVSDTKDEDNWCSKTDKFIFTSELICFVPALASTPQLSRVRVIHTKTGLTLKGFIRVSYDYHIYPDRADAVHKIIITGDTELPWLHIAIREYPSSPLRSILRALQPSSYTLVTI